MQRRFRPIFSYLQIVQICSELLPHWQTARGGRDVRDGLQRRHGLLGHQRPRPGGLLSEQVQHQEGTRHRGDEEGGRKPQGRGGGGLGGWQVCEVSEVSVGLDGEATHVATG